MVTICNKTPGPTDLSVREREREWDFYTSGGNFPGLVPVRPESQPAIARVWLKQAEVDLKALKTMLVQVHREQELCEKGP